MIITLSNNKAEFQKGFSLAELVITMAIAGIFAGLGVVTFSRNLREESLKAATRQSVTWLENLRKKAIQNDTPCLAEINNLQALLQVQADSEQPELERCTNLNYANITATNTGGNLNDLITCSKKLDSGETATDNLESLNLICSTDSSSTVFTPRGTATKSLLIKYTLPGLSRDRCIAVLAPNGLIRSGMTKGGSCDFTTSY